MKLIAGNKWIGIAALVLVVGLISFFVIQYIQSAERETIQLETIKETNKKRERIRDAIDNRPTSDDASDELQFLRDRQGD